MNLDEAEPPRLPPPPFWRTRYFANSVMARPDRRIIEPGMILSVLVRPYRHWLRIVTLEGGETVHTAFLDRDFQP